jgi:hypothetical protein
MVFVPANRDSESGKMPTEEEFSKMTEFNEQLAKAGILLAGEGLHPTSKGKKVRFEGSKTTVIDGPFAPSRELVAGFWIWRVKSMDEAVEWLRRAPFEGGVEVAIRPIYEAEDFGDALTPELREREEKLRAQSDLPLH